MKKFSESEWHDIVEMRKEGATYRQIAEMFGRTERSIVLKFQAMGLSKKRGAKKEQPVFGEPKVITQDGHRLVKVKTLDDFEPREMIRHLYKLGYRIEGQLYHVKRTLVKLGDIVAEA